MSLMVLPGRIVKLRQYDDHLLGLEATATKLKAQAAERAAGCDTTRAGDAGLCCGVRVCVFFCVFSKKVVGQ